MTFLFTFCACVFQVVAIATNDTPFQHERYTLFQRALFFSQCVRFMPLTFRVRIYID